MRDLGKTLIVFGLVLVAVGIVLSFAPKIPWLGRLPGDIYILRGNFTFYFPLTTCILLSLLITLVLYLFRR
jgi:predicted phosphohydrolase